MEKKAKAEAKRARRQEMRDTKAVTSNEQREVDEDADLDSDV